MLIKFKSTDPRAGIVAKMDSYRGQQLVDIGAAFRLNEDGSEPSGATEKQAITQAVKAELKKTLPVKNKNAK